MFFFWVEKKKQTNSPPTALLYLENGDNVYTHIAPSVKSIRSKSPLAFPLLDPPLPLLFIIFIWPLVQATLFPLLSVHPYISFNISGWWVVTAPATSNPKYKSRLRQLHHHSSEYRKEEKRTRGQRQIKVWQFFFSKKKKKKKRNTSIISNNVAVPPLFALHALPVSDCAGRGSVMLRR